MKVPAVLSSKDEKDRAVVAWAADVVRAIKDLQAISFLDGARLDNVSIGTTATEITHKLGRLPRGFIWLNPNVDRVIWQPQAPTTGRMYLQCDTATVADIWVF